MAHRVAWSPRALADVEAIAAYIASDSPFYANAVVRRIITLTRSLSDFPRVEKFQSSMMKPSVNCSPIATGLSTTLNKSRSRSQP